jgi:hypothetical protein
MHIVANVFIPGKTFGLRSEHVEAVDVFVLCTLGFLFAMLGTVAWCFYRLRYRSTYPEPHRQLLIELAKEAPPSPVVSEAPPPPWERPAD